MRIKMQYAEVLIKQKTKTWDATFTYAIGPEVLAMIGVGSIVGVPFGRKKEIEGVVVGLKRALPVGLKGNLKTITRILQPKVKISPDEITCAKWLAQNYLTSWSEAIFAMMPPIPKREIVISEVDPKEKIKTGGKTQFLTEKNADLYRYYLEIIQKNKYAGKTTMIIFPDFMKLKNFVNYDMAELKRHKVLYYRANEKITGRFEKWQKIRSGGADVILASRMGILAQMNNVATVIIDEANHSGHNDDQSPRYNSLEVAQFWQKILHFDILICDINPRLKELVEAKEGKIELMKKTWLKPTCQIKIADMNNEKRGISLALEQMISETIENKETMVLLLPRKGSTESRRCADCGYSFRCPNCDIGLHLDPVKKMLRCQICDFGQKETEICPKCGSANLKIGSFGIEKVAGWIQKEIGGRYPIINLDREIKLEKLPKAIYVATAAIFRYPIEPDVSAVIGTDMYMSRPEYSASETTFYTLFKLAMMTKKTMLIQTQERNLSIYRALESGRYQNFMKELLKQRFQNKYPPYGEIAKIEVEDVQREQAEKAGGEIVKILRDEMENVNVMGPMEAYTRYDNGKFRYIVILKSERKIDRVKLRGISMIAKVEFDPESLL